MYSTGHIYMYGDLAVAPDADHPTRTPTLTLTRTLWSDQCLDAVASEGSLEVDSAIGECCGWGVRISKLAHPGI